MDTFRYPCPACGYYHSALSPLGKLTPCARYKMIVMKRGNPVSMRSYRTWNYEQPYSQLRKQALGPDPEIAVVKTSAMGEFTSTTAIPMLLGIAVIWGLGIWAHK